MYLCVIRGGFIRQVGNSELSNTRRYIRAFCFGLSYAILHSGYTGGKAQKLALKAAESGILEFTYTTGVLVYRFYVISRRTRRL